jgi:hypothetical protein
MAMKYSTLIKSVAGAGMLLGSAAVMATGFGGGWKHDSHTNTLMNTNAPSYESTGPAASMKSKKGSEFADGVSQNSNTGTLMNANVPVRGKQHSAGGDTHVTKNSFGGGLYQDKNTGTLTRID